MKAERVRCYGSGIYIGSVPGHRETCVDCGRRIKIVKDGFFAEHTIPKVEQDRREDTTHFVGDDCPGGHRPATGGDSNGEA